MKVVTRKTTWNGESGWLHATVQLEPGDLPADYDDVEAWQDSEIGIMETAQCIPYQNGGAGQFFAHVPSVVIDYTTLTASVTQFAGYDI